MKHQSMDATFRTADHAPTCITLALFFLLTSLCRHNLALLEKVTAESMLSAIATHGSCHSKEHTHGWQKHVLAICFLATSRGSFEWQLRVVAIAAEHDSAVTFSKRADCDDKGSLVERRALSNASWLRGQPFESGVHD